MITIGVEMMWGNTGLGSVLWLAWETMRMTNLYAVLIIISIIGIGFNWLLEYLQSVLLPCHRRKRALPLRRLPRLCSNPSRRLAFMSA